MWIAIVVLVLVLIVIWIYNRLIQLKNRVQNAWHQIEVQLQRRHDLIPNLVETVKGYASHEKETFERVVAARNKAMSANTPGEMGRAEGELTQALGRLFALAESYPELKANENFIRLQEELTSTENKVAYARQAYNDTVMMFNQTIQMFPYNLLAGPMNLKPAEYYEAEEEAQNVPKVEF
ncbi:MAG TPA: LemA family protein [Coprothermobacter proteolyticus]|uniref:LemA family protein n=1 Tax=Coprothermobacter proteolyticus TaxID=35786 RepID=UPI000D3004B8|nr:LemA family protein [Coprothermobacter proteolyticus]MBK6586387.1 LemA family protein [Coprothermobacter sp.]HOA64617.1 LemA family protein [Coprothermobacter proteolyticus]HOK24750.1 LemA family protein [Coprothermobacter proteolyticus]HOL53536.1 LemA family protein [Coprothermobacter proteolyticus]HPZ44777.1 LemA family protein [Coprothermobacter proteolyticus]